MFNKNNKGITTMVQETARQAMLLYSIKSNNSIKEMCSVKVSCLLCKAKGSDTMAYKTGHQSKCSDNDYNNKGAKLDMYEYVKALR